MATGTLNGEHFRFFQDGTENGAAALAAQDTNASITISGDTIVLLRLKLLQGIQAASGLQLGLAYTHKNSGGTVQDSGNVTSSSTSVQGAASANLTDGNSTTAAPGNADGLTTDGSANFVGTHGIINNTSAASTSGNAVTLNVNDEWEVLIALKLIYAHIANGDTFAFTFRMVAGTDATNQFASSPTLTVNTSTEPYPAGYEPVLPQFQQTYIRM